MWVSLNPIYLLKVDCNMALWVSLNAQENEPPLLLWLGWVDEDQGCCFIMWVPLYSIFFNRLWIALLLNHLSCENLNSDKTLHLHSLRCLQPWLLILFLVILFFTLQAFVKGIPIVVIPSLELSCCVVSATTWSLLLLQYIKNVASPCEYSLIPFLFSRWTARWLYSSFQLPIE